MIARVSGANSVPPAAVMSRRPSGLNASTSASTPGAAMRCGRPRNRPVRPSKRSSTLGTGRSGAVEVDVAVATSWRPSARTRAWRTRRRVPAAPAEGSERVAVEQLDPALAGDGEPRAVGAERERQDREAERSERRAQRAARPGIEKDERAAVVTGDQRSAVGAQRDPQEPAVRDAHDTDRRRAAQQRREQVAAASAASRRSRCPGARAAASGRGRARRAPARRAAVPPRSAPRRAPHPAGRGRARRRRRRRSAAPAAPTSSARRRRLARRARLASRSPCATLASTNARSSSLSSAPCPALQSSAEARRAPR